MGQIPRPEQIGRWKPAQFAVRAGSIPVRAVLEVEEEVMGGGGVTADLIAWARAGDGEAFRQLIEPYQREL